MGRLRDCIPVLLTALALMLGGCSSSSAPVDATADTDDDAASDTSPDASRDVVDLRDEAGEVDATEEDTSSDDDAQCERIAVETSGGEVFEAQLIETYDHRLWWWDVADRTTLALFLAADFAAYPEDESFRFVALSDIASIEDGTLDADDECYLDFIERRAFTVDRLPLDGASQILMGNSGYHRYEGGMGDFAWDFTRVDDTGTRYTDDGSTNDDYLVWGEPVFAPVSGYVVDAVDDARTTRPATTPRAQPTTLWASTWAARSTCTSCT